MAIRTLGGGPGGLENQRTKLEEDWENVYGILHWENLSYILEIVRTEIMSRYYNDLLAGYFKIKNTQELIAQ